MPRVIFPWGTLMNSLGPAGVSVQKRGEGRREERGGERREEEERGGGERRRREE